MLLDLDGTLIDTVPDLAAALNRLAHVRGLAGFTPAETAAMVGDGVAKLVERACAARGCRTDAADVAAFTADYAAHATVASRPYPGVAETLRLLAGEAKLPVWLANASRQRLPEAYNSRAKRPRD